MNSNEQQRKATWHDAAWKTWSRARAQDRIPHAILLTGQSGSGKREFARRLAENLLCRAPPPEGSCGTCKACQMLAAGTHPDFLPLEPEEGKKVISIDQVRGFSETLRLSSHRDESSRVGLINPADRMNDNAANGLLKLLEEPPANRQLILVTDRPGLLPATIRSRCQTLRLPSADHATATAWLADKPLERDAARLAAWATGDAPMAADALCNDPERLAQLSERLDDLERLLRREADPVTLAERCAKDAAEDVLSLHYRAATELLRHRLTNGQTPIADIAALKSLAGALEHLNIYAWYWFTGRLSEWLALQRSQVNSQFLFETVYSDWVELFRHALQKKRS